MELWLDSCLFLDYDSQKQARTMFLNPLKGAVSPMIVSVPLNKQKANLYQWTGNGSVLLKNWPTFFKLDK